MRHAKRNSILIHLAAIVVSLVILLPFGWMVLASVTPQRVLISTPLRWIPDTLDWSRYELIFRGGADSVGATFRAALANTTIVAVGTVAISMIVGILGAYAFARLRFRFRQAVLILFLATYMLPQIALLIPLYLILNSLGLLDTVTGLIIVDCSLVVPFVLWILSNYFLTIPEELEEAARIDGTTRLGALFRVILPAARPGIFAALMFAFRLAY
ncbi:MAG: carbohydrate ABC transporter permease, partial [Actinobacteria bacterium]|nr:carbohydrate ABC transporter permease [Actinomycetota bacterium]